jgi:hypothetical protein
MPTDNDVRLFVRSPETADMWPEEKVQTDPGSLTWAGRVRVGSSGKLIVFVAVVGKEGRKQVNQYGRVADATGQWPAIGEQADDIVECDRVTLVAEPA